MKIAKIGSTVLAESDNTVVVEGNHYFPANAVNWEFFTKTDKTSSCSWKGTAEYYSVKVDGHDLANVAWCYAETLEKATEIKGHIAFYPQITVE